MDTITVEHHAILGLGSNIADGDKILDKAIAKMMTDGVAIPSERSDTYKTPPLSGEGEYYFNGVAAVTTVLDLYRLKQYFKGLEKAFGRDKLKSPEKVPLDIDIVIYDDKVTRPKDYEREYFLIGFRQLNSVPSKAD